MPTRTTARDRGEVVGESATPRGFSADLPTPGKLPKRSSAVARSQKKSQKVAWRKAHGSRRVFEGRLAARRLGCPFIFHQDDQEIGNPGARRFRRAFYQALEACGFTAGRKGFTRYDTKKTAAGLLIDSGLSTREAMHFSGHATESMFDRYIIKSADRHRENVRKRDEYLERRLASKKSADPERISVFPQVLKG